MSLLSKLSSSSFWLPTSNDNVSVNAPSVDDVVNFDQNLPELLQSSVWYMQLNTNSDELSSLYNENNTKLDSFVESINVPQYSYSINTLESHDFEFTELNDLDEITITIYDTADGKLQTFFNNWLNLIISPIYKRVKKDWYKHSATITVSELFLHRRSMGILGNTIMSSLGSFAELNVAAQTLKSLTGVRNTEQIERIVGGVYTMHDCYITGISPISFDTNDSGLKTFSITLRSKFGVTYSNK